MSIQDSHRFIEARLIILFCGLIMLFDGTKLWVNIVGGAFVALTIVRLLWCDVYKALT